MILWLDAQLSPALASWISATWGMTAVAVRDLGLRDAKDRTIFLAARQAGAILMSKDSDFVLLIEQLGPPPPLLWITCGNTSNARMKDVLLKTLQPALALIQQGEALVEISEVR